MSNHDRQREIRLTRLEPPSARSFAGTGIIALIAALVIGGSWHYTRERIADNEARRTIAELAAVLPAGLYDNQPHRDVALLDTGSGRPLPVYRARRNGAGVAVAVTVITPLGYVGPIRLLVGIAADGRVLGVRVEQHNETPGIGAAIDDARSGWLRMFHGRSFSDPLELRWALRADSGDFDAIAGATVSSRAVVSGVRRAVQYFVTHEAEIFAPASTEGTTATP